MLEEYALSIAAYKTVLVLFSFFFRNHIIEARRLLQ